MRVYVASLADYNAGRLHGTWIEDVDMKSGEQTLEEVRVMLSKSQEQVAEEWAIHDHEGFGCVRVGEYDGIENVCALAALIEEHGAAVVNEAIGAGCADADAVEDWISEHYCGSYKSAADYAEELTEECYELDKKMPSFLRYHIDWEGVARDMMHDGYSFVRDNSQCHVFSP